MVYVTSRSLDVLVRVANLATIKCYQSIPQRPGWIGPCRAPGGQ
jgi:hypothetical protein